jgi:hypothetical protein
VEPAIGELGISDEREIQRRKVDQFGVGDRLTAYHDQSPGVVIGAVAMLEAWSGVSGVLPHPAVVGHPFQMIETWRGEGSGCHHIGIELEMGPEPQTGFQPTLAREAGDFEP